MGIADGLAEPLWEMIAMVVDEAEGAYGIALHGRVEKNGPDLYLDFVATDLGVAFKQKVDPGFLSDSKRGTFVEFGIFPTLRKLAEARDGGET